MQRHSVTSGRHFINLKPFAGADSVAQLCLVSTDATRKTAQAAASIICTRQIPTLNNIFHALLIRPVTGMSEKRLS